MVNGANIDILPDYIAYIARTSLIYDYIAVEIKALFCHHQFVTYNYANVLCDFVHPIHNGTMPKMMQSY